MESKFGKLTSIFRKNKETPKPAEESKGFKKSRRAFLRDAGLVATATVLGVPKAFSEEKDINEENDANNNDKEAIDSFERLVQLDGKIREIIFKIETEFGFFGERTLEQQKIARERIKPFFGEIEKLIIESGHLCFEGNGTNWSETIAGNWFGTMIESLYNRLSQVQCQGIIYRILRGSNTYQSFHNYVNKDEFLVGEHFLTLSEDFLPTGDEISIEEIDPRHNSPGLLFRNVDSQSSKKGLKTVNDNLARDPGWSAPEKQTKFKTLLNNEAIRKKIISRNLDLAGAYSLIKAIISFQEKNPQTILGEQEIAEKLLAEQSDFGKRKILHSGTEHFIHLDYYEEAKPKTFDGDILDSIAKSSGVKTENIHRVSGKAENPENDFTVAVNNSSGETTIYFYGHGSKKSFGIDSKRRLSVTDKQLATLLIRRLFRECQKGISHTDDLKNVTILFDGCLSHDLTQNFLAEFKRIYENEKIPMDYDGQVIEGIPQEKIGVPFSEIHLPTIISLTQKGSVGFNSDFSPTRIMQNNIKGIEKKWSDWRILFKANSPRSLCSK